LIPTGRGRSEGRETMDQLQFWAQLGLGGVFGGACLALMYKTMRDLIVQEQAKAAAREKQLEEEKKKQAERDKTYADKLEIFLKNQDAHIARLEVRDQNYMAMTQANITAIVGVQEAIKMLAASTELKDAVSKLVERLDNAAESTSHRGQ